MEAPLFLMDQINQSPTKIHSTKLEQNDANNHQMSLIVEIDIIPRTLTKSLEFKNLKSFMVTGAFGWQYINRYPPQNIKINDISRGEYWSLDRFQRIHQILGQSEPVKNYVIGLLM